MHRRFKSAARIILRGEARRARRTPIPGITPQELGQIKEFFPRDKFFILGHARSGTTLLMRLVRLHPEVHCNSQAHFFTRMPLLKSLVDTPEAEEWLTRKSNRWNHGGDLSAPVLRAAADFIMEREAAAEGKRIVGDKSPSSTIHGQAIRDLHSLYPDARVVYIVRDGRDVLISERFRNFVEESRFLSRADKSLMQRLKQNPRDFGYGKASILAEDMLRRVAEGWATNVSEIASEGKTLFGSRFHALRFEDLLAGPFNQMGRLWAFLGARKPGRSLEKVVRDEMQSNPDEEWQARRNESMAPFLLKGQVGNWRQLFTQGDRDAFKRLAGQALIDWRYETSQDW
jgi:hypothetical protein